jgi:AcrR family transcriptional regulator
MSRHASRTTSTRKAEETRQRVLEAALALFAERGFEATTMRDVASRAGLATGAAYYYFASKEELILEFYRESATESEAATREALASAAGDLKSRVAAVIEQKFAQFLPHRRSLGALFRTAADPDSAISPFGERTRDVRESAIGLFREALAASRTKVPADLESHLPRLLWLYQMGLILFWIYDKSEGQTRTKRLTDRSLDLVVGLIRIARFPLMKPVRRAVVETLESIEDTSNP